MHLEILFDTLLLHIHKSKVHRVKLTQANLNYEGSTKIDEDLMDAVMLLKGEKVQRVNNNNSERIEIYIFKGERGSFMVFLNGAAVRKAAVGNISSIMSYPLMTPEAAKSFKHNTVFPVESNRQN